MKKVAYGIVGFLLVASPVIAKGITVNNNSAHVDTTTITVASTGLNFIGGGRHTEIETGKAVAMATVETDVNGTQVACGTCTKSLTVNNNSAHVDTLTVTAANSGLNFAKSGEIGTGKAIAGSMVLTTVNTTIVGTAK